MKYPDTCKVPADSGTIYNGRCRYQDESLETAWRRPGDQSVKGGGMIFFPVGPSHPLFLRLFQGGHLLMNDSGPVDSDLTISATFGPSAQRITQTGKIGKVERVGGRIVTHIEWQDTATGSTLGTATIQTVVSSGSGAVVIAFTETDGATSYQAKVNGTLVGQAVGANVGYISLTGLTPGSTSFVITASDGSTTTDSDAEVFTVV